MSRDHVFVVGEVAAQEKLAVDHGDALVLHVEQCWRGGLRIGRRGICCVGRVGGGWGGVRRNTNNGEVALSADGVKDGCRTANEKAQQEQEA